MHRFHVDSRAISAGRAVIPPETSAQISRVLRLRSGEEIALFDGSGAEWRVRLESVTPDEVGGTIIDQRWPKTEPQLDITVCQAVLKADRFEFVLQRCTEAGAARFQPVISARCVAEVPRGEKFRRWERIVREAAEQSGRVKVPPISPSISLADVSRLSELRPGVILWEGERSVGLRTAIDKATAGGASRLSLVIGPEGGFEAKELEPLVAVGFPVASLGPRIFRAETAALATLTAALYHLREMG
ncbi:MAG: 16S rRNA (uracil(1498)-N(3))-methyltransferase [Chloroflexi bacterium]|nr:16S rRNA (uracil(1498)-N(3))-methyltransferase [Chloroflexota bacterium]